MLERYFTANHMMPHQRSTFAISLVVTVAAVSVPVFAQVPTQAQARVLHSVAPPTVIAGSNTLVTLHGNFPARGNTVLLFGTQRWAVPNTISTTTSVTFTLPKYVPADNYLISIRNEFGQSNEIPFTVSSATTTIPAATYPQPPSSYTPADVSNLCPAGSARVCPRCVAGTYCPCFCRSFQPLSVLQPIRQHGRPADVAGPLLPSHIVCPYPTSYPTPHPITPPTITHCPAGYTANCTACAYITGARCACTCSLIQVPSSYGVE